MPASLYCPRCGSDQLIRLAKNDISPYRGYLCSGCRRRLRDRGSLPVYLAVLGMGLFFAGAGFANIDRVEIGNDWMKAVVYGLSFAFIVGYVVVELARPTPRRTPRAAGGWHIARNGVATGPWSLDELRQQARQGELTVTDMVRASAAGAWTSAGTVAGLFDDAADT
jgi:hypothetical protein